MKTLQNQLYAVDALQKICVEIYTQVVSSLKTGMSEKDIVEEVRKEFLKRGIRDFWYDVPIFVLIGEERFLVLKEQEYDVKRPKDSIKLSEGDVIYIDIHPQDNDAIWGDFNWMSVYKPKEEDREKVEFLKIIYAIHQQGINAIFPTMTAAELFDWYERQYNKHGITLIDKRDTIGHQMTSGPKKDGQGNYRISFLDRNNTETLAGKIFSIEPGGFKQSNGKVLVGRFEDCVYVPKEGEALILGRNRALPFTS